MDSKIFISYSSQDKPYCDELLPALKAVAGIRERVWRRSAQHGFWRRVPSQDPSGTGGFGNRDPARQQ
jgi:hypothetical protein